MNMIHNVVLMVSHIAACVPSKLVSATIHPYKLHMLGNVPRRMGRAAVTSCAQLIMTHNVALMVQHTAICVASTLVSATIHPYKLHMLGNVPRRLGQAAVTSCALLIMTHNAVLMVQLTVICVASKPVSAKIHICKLHMQGNVL